MKPCFGVWWPILRRTHISRRFDFQWIDKNGLRQVTVPNTINGNGDSRMEAVDRYRIFEMQCTRLAEWSHSQPDSSTDTLSTWWVAKIDAMYRVRRQVGANLMDLKQPVWINYKAPIDSSDIRATVLCCNLSTSLQTRTL